MLSVSNTETCALVVSFSKLLQLFCSFFFFEYHGKKKKKKKKTSQGRLYMGWYPRSGISQNK